MKSTAWFVVALFLAFALAPARASAQTPAPTLEPVLSGLSSPVFVTGAGDGTNRLFVVEQPGRIKVLQPGETTPTVFLDITSRVLDGGERGLLGLAFHPRFASNRRFFVNYTRETDGATVIAEYRASQSNPNLADQAGTVLLVIAQPFANHNGGMIAFGPDGFLYVGMGDGGSANDPGNRAQNIEDLLGKVLRINVDQPAGSVPYSSPPDNPFFGATAGRDEIYATGLRNPFRFSFDRQTGQLYLGDVGQGAREEIDIITRGGNYGWRVFEGTRCTGLGPAPCDPANFVAPVAEYEHTGGRCSVTGGYVYRGTRATLPAGTYVFADFCTGEIFQLQGTTMSLLRDTTIQISSFGEDEAGELYVVGLGGTVHRLVSPSACTYAVAPASRTSPAPGETFGVTVTTQAGCAWTAASQSDFITVASGASGAGSGTVTLTVAQNQTGANRVGTVSVAGRLVTVTQQAFCNYTVSPDGLPEFPAAGGQGSFQMIAPAGCAWQASSLAPWITITAGAGGTGTGTVNFTVAANPGPARTGQILRTDDSFFAVTQAAGGSEFALGAGNPNPGEGAQSVAVNVTRSGNTSQAGSVTVQTVDDPEPVPCATVNGKAYARCDYATTVETLTWAAGDTQTKTVHIPLIDDSRVEGAESLQVRLTSPQGGVLFSSGSVTLNIQDNDAAEGPNPIFGNQFFVRMHYLDFLSREPEVGQPWTAVLDRCPNVFNQDLSSASVECDRLRVSESFFLSPEFRLKGFYTFLFYRAAFNRLPAYEEITPDMRSLAGATPQEVFDRRAAYAVSFTQRQEFVGIYGGLTNQQYVDALLGRYNLQQITTEDPANFEGASQVTLTRQQLVNALNAGTLTRARVLRAVVQSSEVDAAEFHNAFVAMQYYGYLRRAPEQPGYDNWLRVIRQDPSNVRLMVNGFVNSREYKLRFGPP